MRKKLSLIFSVGIIALMLAACGSSNDSTSPSSNVSNGKEETSTTGQIENEKIEKSNGDESSVDSTSTVETTTEAPTTTAEPETTTEAPTTTAEPETTTEAPTTTVEPETTTEAPTEAPTEEPTTTPATSAEVKLTETDIPGIYWRREYIGEDYGWFGEFMVINSDGTIYSWVQTEEGSGNAEVSKITKVTTYNSEAVSCAEKGDYLIYVDDDIIIYSPNSDRTPYVGYEYALEEGARSYREDSMPEGYYVPSNVVFEKGGPSTEVSTEIPTEAPTTTVEPETTTEASVVPSVKEDEKKEPSGSGWTGDYDKLPSDGFDHIKVPTIDDFYDEGLDNPGGAFDFGNRPEWEEEWYDAYNEFLVANDSPIHPDTGIPIPAFYAVNPGSTFINGATYQYLYYGFRGDTTNGWGDIVLYPNGFHPTIKDDSNYKGSYVLEFTNFTFGNMDKGLENEYRAATTMMLSWICPNPSQVEEAIYEFHTNESGSDPLSKLVDTKGCGAWVQIGEVDVCVTKYDFVNGTFMFSIRAHR